MQNSTCPSRRHVLTAGATGAAGVAGMALLAACGGGSDTGPSSSGSASTPAAAAGTVIAPLADVPAGGTASLTGPDGAQLVAYRPETGDPVVFSAVCPHAGSIVAPSGDLYLCPLHKSRFDEKTGAVINGPSTEPLTKIATTVSGTEIVTA